MKRLLPLVALVFFLTALPASAAVFHSGEEFTLSQGETLSEDLYAAGSSITSAGTIEGDVITAGGKVLINGAVMGDVMSAGGSVDILSAVGDDVRVAGGQVVISGTVGGDLLAFGGQVQVLDSVSAAGDAVIAGGRVVIDGDVAGDMRVYGNDVQVNGVVGGDLEVFADNAFTMGENARVGGNLSYRAPKELTLSEGAVVGEVDFEEHSVRFDRSLLQAVSGAAFTLQLLMLLVAALLATVLFGSFTHDFARFAVPHFGKSLLIGFVVLIVVPVLVLLLTISFIGAFVAVIATLSYILLLAVAKIYAGILTGMLLARGMKKEIVVDWRFTTIGVIVLQLVSLVPFIGFAVSLIIMLAAFGALAHFAYQRFWVAR